MSLALLEYGTWQPVGVSVLLIIDDERLRAFTQMKCMISL